MPDIKGLTTAYSVSSGEVIAAAAALKAAKATQSKALRDIRTTIRKGGTTGDVAEDLMYLQGGPPDPAMADFFRSVQGKLAGKTGSLVVIAISKRSEYSDSDPELMECGVSEICGGILTSDTLMVDRKYDFAELPVASHLLYLHYLNRVDEGSILFSPPRPKPYYVYGVDVYVGDEIFDLYASQPQFGEFILTMKGLPGRPALFDAFPVPALVLAA